MASLSQTLRNNKSKTVRGTDGTLSEETPESIQTLAGKVGIAPPTTAIGAAALGANPDQVKMQGTPAQKQAALDISGQMSQADNLQTAVRTGQARTQATAEEQQGMQKSEDMRNLGSVGERVTSFIDAERQKLSAASQAPVAVETADTIQNAQGREITGQSLSQVKDLLNDLRQNPGDMELQLQLNELMGYNQSNTWDPAKVEQAYESAVSSISKGAAGTVDDALTVQDLISQPEFGYDENELAQLLGVDPQILAGMNVGQLRNEIARVTQEEFTQAQTLQDKSQSGLLGQAERGLAREAGREASAVGIRASDADMARLDESMQRADKVLFGGQEMTIEEALQDETISNVVKDYMESAPGSDYRKMLERSEPGLIKFISEHQTILDEATKNMQTGAQDFRDIQESNIAQGTISGIKLDEAIARKVIPGFGTLQASRIDPATIPVLGYANGLPSEDRKMAFVNEINKAVADDDSIPDQLAGLSAAELAALAPGKTGSNWTRAMEANTAYRKIQTIPPSDLAALLAAVIDPPVSQEQYTAQKAQGSAMNVFGINSGLNPKLFEGNLKDLALEGSAPTSLKNAAAGNITAPKKIPYGTFNSKIPFDTAEGQLYSKLGDLATDGSLDSNDLSPNNPAIRNILDMPANSGLDLLIALEDKSGNGKIDKGAATSLRQQMTEKNTQDALDMAMYSGNPGATIEAYVKLGQNRDPRKIDTKLYSDQFKKFLLNEFKNGNRDIGDYLRQAVNSGVLTQEEGNNYGKMTKEIGSELPKVNTSI